MYKPLLLLLLLVLVLLLMFYHYCCCYHQQHQIEFYLRIAQNFSRFGHCYRCKNSHLGPNGSYRI